MAQEIAANWFVQAMLPVPVTKKLLFFQLCNHSHWPAELGRVESCSTKTTGLSGALIFLGGFVGFSEATPTERSTEQGT